MRTILREVTKGDNDVYYAEVLDFGANRLRVKIRSNYLKRQGSATVSRHDGTQWHGVHEIVPAAMATNEKLLYRPAAPTVEDFRADRDELLRVACALLDIPDPDSAGTGAT